MSLLDRLNLLIRSEMSDLTRRGKNPMGEMEGSLKEARRQKAELRRSEAKLLKQIREVREKAERWEERAVLALKNGDEDLAREALVMKNRTLDEAAQMRDDLDHYRAQIQDLERALEALEMKLEGTRGRLRDGASGSSLDAEAKWDAEMRRRRTDGDTAGRTSASHLDPLEDIGGFGTSGAFDEFDRMSSKISAMEADIDAMRELTDDDPLVDPRRREIEEKFRRMERRKQTDEQLSDLKKRKAEDDDLSDLKNKFK